MKQVKLQIVPKSGIADRKEKTLPTCPDDRVTAVISMWVESCKKSGLVFSDNSEYVIPYENIAYFKIKEVIDV